MTTAIGRCRAVINIASGTANAASPAEMAEIFRRAGLEAEIAAAEPENLEAALKAALAGKPDLLVVLAGDGTARRAAELAGFTGPVLAPLAGGTLNILPHALYGEQPWQTALAQTLAAPRQIEVAGGRAGNHAFFVAAVLGSPALWAQAREAVRHHQPLEAMHRAKTALDRAFSSRVRYAIDGGEEDKAEALAVLCPLISPVLDDAAQVLEVAALDPAGLGDAVRIGLLASLGRWRDDKTVHLAKARSVAARAHQAIPAIVDGESVSLGRACEVSFAPRAFRALVPAK